METIYTYKTDTEWIGYVHNQHGVPILSAHTDNKKYGYKMLKVLYETFNRFDEVITVLPYDYLLNFYSKHFMVQCLDKDNKVYVIKRR